MAATGRMLKTQYPDLYDLRIKNAWVQGYGEPKHEFEPFFIVGTTDKQDERGSYISGFGMWLQSTLGDAVTFDSVYQGYDTTITPYTYKLGFQIEQETVEDDPHNLLGTQLATNLAQTGRYTTEYLAASVFNNAFTTIGASPWMSGANGEYLFETTHDIPSGGTYANRPAADIALSQSGVEAGIINMRKTWNSRGLLTPYEAKQLVVPTDRYFDARQLIEATPYETGQANFNPNLLRGLVTVETWSHLSSTTAWFLSAGKQGGIGNSRGINTVAYWRIKPEFDRDNHFETGDRRYKGRFRLGFGWFDWRGWYGTDGVP